MTQDPIHSDVSPEQCHVLATAALAAREHAYAPYSGLQVGAALLTESGEVVAGANVENVSYGLTICAERSAIGAAVAAGHRHFTAVAVASSAEKEGRAIPPCGACRQVLAEFNPAMIVLCVKSPTEWEAHRLDDLLPEAFHGWAT